MLSDVETGRAQSVTAALIVVVVARGALPSATPWNASSQLRRCVATATRDVALETKRGEAASVSARAARDYRDPAPSSPPVFNGLEVRGDALVRRWAMKPAAKWMDEATTRLEQQRRCRRRARAPRRRDSHVDRRRGTTRVVCQVPVEARRRRNLAVERRRLAGRQRRPISERRHGRRRVLKPRRRRSHVERRRWTTRIVVRVPSVASRARSLVAGRRRLVGCRHWRQK